MPVDPCVRCCILIYKPAVTAKCIAYLGKALLVADSAR